MSFGRVEMHVLYAQTVSRLELLGRRVRENVDVVAASEFVRYLEMAGVLKLLDGHTSAFPLEVNPKHVRKLCGDLLSECGDRMQGGKSLPVSMHKSELEILHERFDALERQMERIAEQSLAQHHAATKVPTIDGLGNGRASARREAAGTDPS